MNFKQLWSAAAIAAAFAAPAAHAELVFSPAELGAGVLVQAFDVADAALMDTAATRMQIGASLGADVGVTAIDGSFQIGSNFGAWGLGANGEWTDTTDVNGVDSTFLALNGVVDFDTQTFATLSFDFGGQLVSGVGAFMSYDPDFSYLGLPIQLYIAAYDASGELIEYSDLPFAAEADEFGNVTPNQGAFYGIKLDTPSIARFEVSAPYAVIDNFSFTTPVPEPSTWALLLAGVATVGALARRKA